jgi:hypothetical protein
MAILFIVVLVGENAHDRSDGVMIFGVHALSYPLFV